MQLSSFLSWAMFSLSVAHCLVLSSLPSAQNVSNQQEGPADSEEEDCYPRTVSIVDELIELGKHPETACPFRVENTTMEQQHPLGNVTLDINEILCSGSCVAGNCGEPGRDCKQLLTSVQVSINNMMTGKLEKMFSANVAIGCSCTPQDPGVLGEDVQ